MLDPELLDILVCPEARTPVRMADDVLLQGSTGPSKRARYATGAATSCGIPCRLV